jgi:hypothetical protein
MFINKLGEEHREYGINCQDYGFIKGNVKCVVDGCSEGKHSEVGTKLFCHLITQEDDINEDIIKFAFEQILFTIGNKYETIRDHLCFTIMYIVEQNDKFVAYTCGDGFIIKHKLDDTIEYEKIDNGEYPIYYAYNYVDKKYLKQYKDGVTFDIREYSKEEFKNIGVATDGLRYIFNNDLEEDFTELLLKNKESVIKRFINKNHNHFKDDITIAI